MRGGSSAPVVQQKRVYHRQRTAIPLPSASRKMPDQKITIEEARASGRVVEKKISNITYTYAGVSNSWIDGHEWAGSYECEARTVGSRTRLGTRSWLLAQLY